MNRINWQQGIKLLSIAIAGGALLAAVGCGNGVSGLDQSIDLAGKGASGSRTTTTTSTKVSVTAKIGKSTTSTSVTFSCYGTTLVQGTLFFTDGTSVSKSFSGTSGTVSASRTGLWYCRAKVGSGDYWYFDKNGDYWYFDKSGTWQPTSTSSTARSTSGWHGGNRSDDGDAIVTTGILTTGGEQISVTFRDGDVFASSTSGLIEIDACYWNDSDEFDLDGNKDNCDLDGSGDCLYYKLLTGDGGVWIFAADGSHVPQGLVNQLGLDDDNKNSRKGNRHW